MTDAWFRPYLDDPGKGTRVLDLGCGAGEDAEALAALGFEVVATDLLPKQLDSARSRIGSGALQRVDHRHALPFRDSVFAAALASLSLHYFRWAETLAAFAEIQGRHSSFV